MSDKDLMLTLAKVIIAAAWSDGEMTQEEVSSLKNMLLWSASGQRRDLQINQREWAMLEMYVASPVDATEREQLVQKLQAELRTPQDRKLALSALQKIIQADGAVTKQEQVMADEITAALEDVNLGVFGQLGRLVRQSVNGQTLEREQYLDDFIKNRVYYALRRHLDSSGAELNLPEDELRKLSLAGALMAQVAQVDREVEQDEFDQMIEALQTGWAITPEAATFVAEIATSEIDPSEDHFRLVSEFANSTTLDERAGFLEVLFAVAKADGEISFAETEEIRSIANTLLLPHKQFIEAKLKVSNQQ